MSEPPNPHPPLTEEERLERDRLNHQEALAAWSAREADRLAKAAQVQPMLDALPSREDAQALIAAIDANVNGLPFHLSARMRRLRDILSIDLVGFHTEVQPILTPEPEPVPAPTPA